MSLHRRMSIWGIASSLAVAAAVSAVSPANADGPPTVAAPVIVVKAGPAPATPTTVEPSGLQRRAAPTATFQVTYSGFTPEAQAAFQRAVDIWSTKLSSPVPITVSATFSALGAGVLGQAGASSLYRDFAGAEQSGTYYVDAIANKQAGRQVSASPDINASFSSNFSNWHYGTDPAPAGKYDFTSVVLHELGHGLGFLGAGNVNSAAQGTVTLQGFPVSYDRFTENGSGTTLLSYPDNSSTLGSQLRSRNIFFDSTQVRAVNSGATAKLYAPSTWEPGSSYSHLDEASYPAGNPNSLMTPQIGAGETIRDPGALALAVYDTIGW